MLTSMNWPGDITEIRRLGAVALLNKPVHQRGLITHVAAALGAGAPDNAADRHAASGPIAGPPREKIDAHVLVAEDNPANVEVASAFLETHGCRVTTASNGREAVEAFATSTFDLILMDCQMPELDGLAATRQIREREARDGVPRTPVIAVTASAFEEDRQACLAAGMDDFLSKPFTKAELTGMLSRWAGSGRKAEAADPGHAEPSPAPHGERSTVVALARPVRDTLRARQVRSFLNHTPNAIESLRNALDRCDCVALKLAAHSLKSSSASIGADALAQILLAIEKAALVSDLHAATNHVQQLNAEIPRLFARLEDEIAHPRVELSA
jgi:CheY-like chemotaxis protein